MADFGLGTLATGHLTVSQNWNTSYQVSYHVRLWFTTSGGAYNYGPGPSWNGNAGGVTGSGTAYYSGNGDHNLWEFDYTYTKDANGNGTWNFYGYINGDNPPHVTANSTNFNLSPTRIGVAPTMNNPVASNVSVATATISGTNANNGLGTSTTVYLRYKRTADSDATYQQLQTTSWALTGLMPGTSHTFQIYGANNNGDTNGWQNTQTFTTLPAPANSTAMLNIIGVI